MNWSIILHSLFTFDYNAGVLASNSRCISAEAVPKKKIRKRKWRIDASDTDAKTKQEKELRCSELDLELAPTCMIYCDLENFEIITFESSLQNHHVSCYLVNLIESSIHVQPSCAQDLTSYMPKCLFDVGTGRISIVTMNTVKYHSDVLGRSQ
ncbi:hypothetical protein Tco_1034446, partial [Tanacetum coccineum]